jgi:hypothetical protein
MIRPDVTVPMEEVSLKCTFGDAQKLTRRLFELSTG